MGYNFLIFFQKFDINIFKSKCKILQYIKKYNRQYNFVKKKITNREGT
jgi:signal recognition particle receptor subunit beta